MKSLRWTLALLGALLLGAVLGAILFGNPAVAQAPPAASLGRFQVSAYSGPGKDGLAHGCYIVDTTTGEVWHTKAGAVFSATGKADKVSTLPGR